MDTGSGGAIQLFLPYLALIPAALVAIPLHEIGHGLAAARLGDPAAANRMRLGGGYRQFIEPYGLVAVFLAQVGWGRPVAVNEYRLRGGAPSKVLYALAGPAANLVAAALFAILLRLASRGLAGLPAGTGSDALALLVGAVLFALFFLNLSLFAFNLLPIPGLDGWRVLEALFQRRNPRFFYEAAARRTQIWNVIILVVVVISFLPPHLNLLALAMSPFFQPASTILVGACVGYPAALTGLRPCLV